MVKPKKWAKQWSVHRTANILLGLPYVTLGSPDKKADINYFPLYSEATKVGDSVIAAKFTERRRGTEKKFDKAMDIVDYPVFESKLWAERYDAPYVEEWVGKEFYHKPVIGIASKESGSKWHDKLKEFIEENDISKNFKWKWARGAVSYKDMPAWYEKLDYIMVYSESEGFCIPIIEAIASGVQVISREKNIGAAYKADFLFNTDEELVEVLQDIIDIRDHRLVGNSPDDYKREYSLIFQEICDKENIKY